MTLAEQAQRLKSRRGKRCAVPSAVLVTDDRLLKPLEALRRLPRGGMVVIRGQERRRLALLLLPVVRRRNLRMVISTDWRLAACLGVGVHMPEAMIRHGDLLSPVLGCFRHRRRYRNGRCGTFLTVACHTPAALRRAARCRADAAFLSPMFATRSHPGARTVGRLRGGVWARYAVLPVIALGGITEQTARPLAALGFCGLAAVGGWTEQ